MVRRGRVGDPATGEHIYNPESPLLTSLLFLKSRHFKWEECKSFYLLHLVRSVSPSFVICVAYTQTRDCEEVGGGV